MPLISWDTHETIAAAWSDAPRGCIQNQVRTEPVSPAISLKLAGQSGLDEVGAVSSVAPNVILITSNAGAPLLTICPPQRIGGLVS
jgi:hypothetical protein